MDIERDGASPEFVAFMSVDGSFGAFLDILPHAVTARLFAADASESDDEVEAAGR